MPTNLAIKKRRGGRGLYPYKDKSQQITRYKALPEYLTQQEVETLIRCTPHAIARLLMLEQWRAGLRVSEALALTRADLHIDIDTDNPTLQVRHGKGNKARVVPVHPELAVALTNYLAYSPRKPQDEPLIQVSRLAAYLWVRKAYDKAVSLDMMPPGRRISTHTLRHSAARHWLMYGTRINVVQLWLGHSNLSSTLIYLRILPDPEGQMNQIP